MRVIILSQVEKADLAFPSVTEGTVARDLKLRLRFPVSLDENVVGTGGIFVHLQRIPAGLNRVKIKSLCISSRFLY